MATVCREALARLNHVRTKGVQLRDLAYFPDFLILGPQRTGTTWLAKVLWRHPSIFMSFPKELYFFNLLEKPEHRLYTSNELKWYLSRFRDNPISFALKSFWAARRLQRAYRPLLRGEATASYAALSQSFIHDIVTLNPSVKGIMFVRDPVERAWSHAKKDLCRARNRHVKDVSDEEFDCFFRDPYQIACADYAGNIQKWSAALRTGNLFIGRFEEIETDPQGLLSRLLSFLGLSTDLAFANDFLHERINVTEDVQIADRHRAMLRDALGERICDTWQQVSLDGPASRRF
jgi:hypothetical protein